MKGVHKQICNCFCHKGYVVHRDYCCYICKICNLRIKANSWEKHQAKHGIYRNNKEFYNIE